MGGCARYGLAFVAVLALLHTSSALRIFSLLRAVGDPVEGEDTVQTPEEIVEQGFNTGVLDNLADAGESHTIVTPEEAEAMTCGGHDVANRDLEVLSQFFESNGGEQWAQNALWGANDHVCQWDGVICHDYTTTSVVGRVTGLRLPDNNISGNVTVLTQLHCLQVLWLPGNELGGEVNADFWDLLSNLIVLNLSNNKLSGIIDPKVGRLHQARSINLSGNDLVGMIPTEFGQLGKTLTHLTLGGNKFDGAIPNEIGNLKELAQLDVSKSSTLGGLIPTTIGLLTKLQRLILSENKLVGEIPKEIGGLESLVIMHMHNNELAGAVPSEITRLSKLKNLKLVHNELCINDPAVANFTLPLMVDLDGVPFPTCNCQQDLTGAVYTGDADDQEVLTPQEEMADEHGGKKMCELMGQNFHCGGSGQCGGAFDFCAVKHPGQIGEDHLVANSDCPPIYEYCSAIKP